MAYFLKVLSGLQKVRVMFSPSKNTLVYTTDLQRNISVFVGKIFSFQAQKSTLYENKDFYLFAFEHVIVQKT